MSNGWIKLHRKIINWEWYKDNKTMSVFIHCMLKANHKDNTYRGTLVKRGQFLTSQDILASELNLSRQQIRTSLNNLKSTNQITIESSRKGTVVTVIGYNEYQDQPTDQPTDQPETNQQDNHKSTSNKNDKEEKNFNIGSDEPKKPKGTGKRKKIKYSEEFEIFWKQWYSIADRPTESKESAFNEFKKLDIEEQRIAYKNIKPYSESLDDKKYMKHCCRYLKSGIFLNKFFSTTSQNIDHAFELKKEQARKDMLEAFENVG